MSSVVKWLNRHRSGLIIAGAVLAVVLMLKLFLVTWIVGWLADSYRGETLFILCILAWVLFVRKVPITALVRRLRTGKKEIN